MRSLPRSALLLPLLLLGGCGMVVLDPTGDVAIQQRNLIAIATGLMLLIIVPVLVLVFVFAWRYRQGGGGTYDKSFDHSTSLELVIWSCPLLIIIALGAVTWSSTHLLDPYRPLNRISADKPMPPGTKPMEVQVVALDWKWLFIYPDLGIASVNELALPVDVPVRFAITSSTQMNTFYAPTMAGMIYAMPGMQTVLHAVVNKPGESWGQSSNYTGRGFADMRFRLLSLDGPGFNRWVADARARAEGRELARPTYVELEKPTEKAPVAFYAPVSAGLFERVVNRCVEPGKPCAAHVMHGDRGHGASPMPAANEGETMHDHRATPALRKPAEEKGTGPNVTAPPKGEEPGPLDPGSPHNRDHSELTLPRPGAAPVGAPA